MVLSPKQYKILGRLVVKRHPDLAETLIQQLAQDKPLQHDIQKIQVYFTCFCNLPGIEAFFGPSRKMENVDACRLFIATMIRLYYPELHHQPIEELNLRKTGFVSTVAETIGLKVSNVSYRIRQVVRWEHQYDDFRLKVQETLKNLQVS
jgi:hypothetical protein